MLSVLCCAVPLVTHLHGQNGVADYSDGYPEVCGAPRGGGGVVAAAPAALQAAAGVDAVRSTVHKSAMVLIFSFPLCLPPPRAGLVPPEGQEPAGLQKREWGSRTGVEARS